MKKFRRRLIALLIGLLLCFPLAEGLTRLLDPLGAWHYAQRLVAIYVVLRPGQPYAAAPGEYKMDGWTFTVLPDGTRRVPHSGAGPCTLVVLGDSVAFGMGVNDDETFADHLARMLPAWRVRLAAHPGYALTEIEQAQRRWPGDAYLYFIIDNDLGGSWTIGNPIGQSPLFPALSVLVSALREINAATGPLAPDLAASYAQRVQAMGVNILAGFAGDRLPDALERAGRAVIRVSRPYPVISAADPHPNRWGHEHIALALMPVMQRIQDTCKQSGKIAGK